MTQQLKKTTSIVKLLLAGLGTLGLSVIAQRAAHTKTRDNRLMKQESKSFTVDGNPLVRIETFDGHVNVRAWDKAEVKVTAAKRAKDDEEMRGVSVRAEQRGGEIVIIAEFDAAFKREVSINGGRFMSFSASVDFEVYVPRTASIAAKTKDGAINVESFGGEADLQTDDGTVEVGGGSGRLLARTDDGEIRVRNFDGAATIHSGDGQLKLDGRFSQLDASTAKGSIWLSLPSDFNATVETKARSVNPSNGFAVADAADTQSQARRWRIGTGGTNVLKLRAEAGDISLRRSTEQARATTAR